jgi:hypothetical protein
MNAPERNGDVGGRAVLGRPGLAVMEAKPTLTVGRVTVGAHA